MLKTLAYFKLIFADIVKPSSLSPLPVYPPAMPLIPYSTFLATLGLALQVSSEPQVAGVPPLSSQDQGGL